MLLALAGSFSQAVFAAAPALMPMPAKVQPTSGKLAINANFVVETVGGAGARLAPAVKWFLARVSSQTGVIYAPQPPAPANARQVVIDCAGGPEYPTLGEDESYTLDVSDTQARIKAATAEGAIHGLATFAQLIQPGPDGFQVAGVHIEDRPRFPWRGLMLDSCRHWMPVELVKRNLDAMAAVKLNVFHWHISEDQAFRVESLRLLHQDQIQGTRPTGTMPLNRFVDACQPESELLRSMELATKRFVANPADAKEDAAMLRRQFETWAANDALFQPLAENNSLLEEVKQLSKDLSALGEAGLKLLDYLVPPPPAPVARNKKVKKPSKAELAAQKAAQVAQAQWLAKLNAELARLSRPPVTRELGWRNPGPIRRCPSGRLPSG
jgi:Glycosyl hydrolase family 20, catalytic domain/Glycosyl hydrolase family 20, domain 2